jgi:hypothetical protein
MSDPKEEGKMKKCGNCQTDIICVRVVSEWKGKTEEKLQWQNIEDGKPHFLWVSEGNFDCKPPVDAAPKSPEQVVQDSMDDYQRKKEVDIRIKVAGPFDEAELMARWASDRAFKMVMAGIENANKLTPQEKSGLGQKEGMLTRLLVDTVLELRKQNGIKSEYSNA